jgi:hypothetical protein
MRKKILREFCLAIAFVLVLNLALVELNNGFKIINEANAQAGPRIKVESLNETLSSNAVNNVVLRIKNEGNGDAKSITLQIIPLNTYLTLIGSNVYTIESLGEGASQEIIAKIYVAKGVSGSTGLRISVTFRDEFWHFQEVIYSLGFKITGNVEFALQQNWQEPSKIFPGDLNIILTAVIVNTGSKEATHLNVTLKLPEGIKPSWAKSNNVYIGNAFPDTPMECKFYLDVDESTSHGLYNLELELAYDDGRSILIVPLFISEKADFEIIDLSISQKEIHPGDRGIKIQATIKNSGNVKAEEVVIKLIGSSFSGMTTSFLGVLNPNDKARAIFEVDVSREAPIGENMLQFQVSWMQEGRSLTQNIFYKIQISSSNLYFYASLFASILVAIFIVIYLVKRISRMK